MKEMYKISADRGQNKNKAVEYIDSQMVNLKINKEDIEFFGEDRIVSHVRGNVLSGLDAIYNEEGSYVCDIEEQKENGVLYGLKANLHIAPGAKENVKMTALIEKIYKMKDGFDFQKYVQVVYDRLHDTEE